MSGWETKRLGEVSELIARGIAPSYLEAGGVCVLNQKCVRDHALNFAFARRHDSAAKKVPSDRFIRRGDVLVNSTGTGTLGRVAPVRTVPSEPATVDTHVTIIRPEAGKFDPDFFGYLLITIEDEIAASGAGASGQTELARSTLAEKFTVSYPTSLAEQRRIVAILDEAFTALATMHANAEANLKNATALFETHLSAIFSEGGEGWREVSLSEVAKVQSGAGFPEKHQGAKEGDYPFYKVSDMNLPGNEARMTTANNFVSEAVRKGLGARVFPPGAIIFPKVGGAIATNKKRLLSISSCVDNNVMGIIPTEGKLSSNYLAKLMLNKNIYEFSNKAALPSIRQSTVEEWRFMLPSSTDEQDIFAERVDDIAQLVSRLEAVFDKKLAAINALKQSVLAKAFAGELKRGSVAHLVTSSSAAGDDSRPMTAAIMARAFARHQRNQRDLTFGHVKAQKTLHMVEAVAGYELGRTPIKDAAGPNDMPHMGRAERWAEDNRHFRFPKVGEGYRLEPLDAFDALLRQTAAIETIQLKAIDRVIDIFIPMDTREAELFATVYAAWNNLLIDRQTPVDDAIIREAREDWHREKLKIDRAEFVKALAAVRRSGMIPTGKGKRVGEPAQARFL